MMSPIYLGVVRSGFNTYLVNLFTEMLKHTLIYLL